MKRIALGFILFWFLMSAASAERMALVDAVGNVVNVVEVKPDDPMEAPEGLTVVYPAGPEAEPGGTYVDGVFTRAPRDPVVDPSQPSEEEIARKLEFKGEQDRIDLLDRLNTATPAQIDTWIDNNVTSLASARAVLKAIIKVIAHDGRD